MTAAQSKSPSCGASTLGKSRASVLPFLVRYLQTLAQEVWPDRGFRIGAATSRGRGSAILRQSARWRQAGWSRGGRCREHLSFVPAPWHGRGRRRWPARISSACIAPCSSDLSCERETREIQRGGASPPPAYRSIAGTYVDVQLSLRIGAARPRIRSAAIRGEPGADKRCLGCVCTKQAAC